MPSLLDGFPKTEAEMRQIHYGSAVALGEYMAGAEVTPKAKSIFEALGKGLSLADIMDIGREERDALLVQGFRQMQQGNNAGAQDTLTTLYYLEPTDERVIYALAATYQAQEKYAPAAKLYLNFLALDATNPEGYLRLGECFMANREYDEARAYFEAAKIQAVGGETQDAVTAHADRMLDVIETRIAEAA